MTYKVESTYIYDPPHLVKDLLLTYAKRGLLTYAKRGLFKLNNFTIKIKLTVT